MSHRGGGLIEAARICNSPGGSLAAIIHQECAPRERKWPFFPFLLLFSIFGHRSLWIIVAGVQREGKESGGSGCWDKDVGVTTLLSDVSGKPAAAVQHKV